MIDKTTVRLYDEVLVRIQGHGSNSFYLGTITLISERGIDVKMSDNKAYFIKWKNVIKKK